MQSNAYLGPAWLDRYVRTILYEAIANGLEDGIINGRGTAEGAADPDDYIYEPIGMIKDLTNFNVINGYADKIPIPVNDFSPENYGALIAQLSIGPNFEPHSNGRLLVPSGRLSYADIPRQQPIRLRRAGR